MKLKFDRCLDYQLVAINSVKLNYFPISLITPLHEIREPGIIL